MACKTSSVWTLFCLTLFISYATGFPVWTQHRSLNIYVTGGRGQFYVKRFRNTEKVRLDKINSFSGWRGFQHPDDQFRFMFGINHNEHWFFMEPQNDKIRINRTEPPVGAISPRDNRLFSYVKHGRTDSFTLKHVATGKYIAVNWLHQAILTNSSEKSLPLLLPF